jgi:hypothetical protein
MTNPCPEVCRAEATTNVTADWLSEAEFDELPDDIIAGIFEDFGLVVRPGAHIHLRGKDFLTCIVVNDDHH